MTITSVGLWVAFVATFMLMHSLAEKVRERASTTDQPGGSSYIGGFLYILMWPLLILAIIVSLLTWPVQFALWTGSRSQPGSRHAVRWEDCRRSLLELAGDTFSPLGDDSDGR